MTGIHLKNSVIVYLVCSVSILLMSDYFCSAEDVINGVILFAAIAFEVNFGDNKGIPKPPPKRLSSVSLPGYIVNYILVLT